MAKKSNFQTRLEYSAAKLALGLIGLLPRTAAVRIAIWIMLPVPVLLRKLKQTGMRNLEIAFPEKTPAERAAILRGTFENLGRVLGDLSQFHKYDRERLAELIDYELDETSRELYERQKNGKGVL